MLKLCAVIDFVNRDEGCLEVTSVDTTPIDGQKPGTSGLRKKTKLFMSPNYLENFVQSTFDALAKNNVPVTGGTIVISGDGRYTTSNNLPYSK